jgi:H+/gluconate symporter-like permease
MLFLNQHSFTLVGAAALLALAVLLLRDGLRGSDLMALGALALGLGLAFLLLNPGPSTLAQAEAVQAQIGAGAPVLLEFQSVY